MMKKSGPLIHKGWKIFALEDGSTEAVRINPTKFFRASSVDSAIRSIDRREAKTTATLKTAQQISKKENPC